VDPDARVGKKTNHSWRGYKAHIVIEEETGIITGVKTTRLTPRMQPAQPMLKEQEEVHSINLKDSPVIKLMIGEKIWNHWIEQDHRKYQSIKAGNRNGAGYFAVDDFLYDPENIKLMCPAGHISTSCYSLVLAKYQQNKPGYAFQFKAGQCNICPLNLSA